MKQRQLTEVMSAKEIKLAEIKEKRKSLVEKNKVTSEDLMKNIIYAINDLKETIEESNNVPNDALNKLSEILLVIKKQKTDIILPEKRKLKSVVPIRDANNIAIQYDFEWDE